VCCEFRSKTPEINLPGIALWIGLSRLWRDWRSALAIVSQAGNGRMLPRVRSNFGPIQAQFRWRAFGVSDTRCSTYLIFTAFLTAECSTVELPGNIPIFICLRGGCKPNAGDMGDMTESKSSIFNASFPRIHASHDLDIRGFRHTFLTVPEPNLD
jgi:hypothetical protein